jgi:type IV pilus assembly protein PilC
MSEAMKLQARSFPELLVNMYASGETSGQLEQVATKMAVHYEKEHRLNGKVKTATTYPTILLSVTIIVVMLIFTVVLPQFFQILEGIELPAITQLMIGISGFLQNYWFLVILFGLVLVLVYKRLQTIDTVAFHTDRIKLRIAIVGKLLKIIYTARFARTLSSLYSSGISMITALEVSSTIVGNKYIERQFGEVIKNVRNGEALSVAINNVDGFDNKLSATIMIGEESGRLDSMLVSTAESFDYEAEVATGRLVQLIEPVMIVILAVVVGAIMLSVMLPIMTLYENVGNL